MLVSVALALSSVAVGELPSVMTGKELSSVMVGDALSSVAVGVAESSVVRVTPVTKPEPVGKMPVGIPMPVPKSVLVESPVG